MFKKMLPLLCTLLATLIVSQSTFAHPSYWGEGHSIPPFLTPAQWANPDHALYTEELTIWMYNLMGREISSNKEFADIYIDAFNLPYSIAPKGELSVAEAVAYLSLYAGSFISEPGVYSLGNLKSVVVTTGDVMLENMTIERLLIAEFVDSSTVILRNMRIGTLTIRGGDVRIESSRISQIIDETEPANLEIVPRRTTRRPRSTSSQQNFPQTTVVLPTPSPSPIPISSPSPMPLTSPSPSPSPEPSPSATPTPSPSPSPSPEPSPAPSPNPSPSPEPSPIPSPSPSPEPSPNPSPSPSPPQPFNISTNGKYTFFELDNGKIMLSHDILDTIFYYQGNTLNFLQVGDSVRVNVGTITEKHLRSQHLYQFSPAASSNISFFYSGGSNNAGLQLSFGTMTVFASGTNDHIRLGPSNRITIYDGNVELVGLIARNIYIEGGQIEARLLNAFGPITPYINISGGDVWINYALTPSLAPALAGRYRWYNAGNHWRRE